VAGVDEGGDGEADAQDGYLLISEGLLLSFVQSWQTAMQGAGDGSLVGMFSCLP
jgi:hypothetical protein